MAGAARSAVSRPLPAPPAQAPTGAEPDTNPFKGLGIRVTYRTMRVLSAIGELSADGVGPSSAQVARHAGVRDLGQISKLLARLSRAGLIENGALGVERGEPYAWALTARGLRLHRAVAQQAGVVAGASNRHEPR